MDNDNNLFHTHDEKISIFIVKVEVFVLLFLMEASSVDEKITAIILAAGKGSRMQSEMPKQYLPLFGKPILFYSLQAFEQSIVDEIILVVGKQEQEYCKKEIVEKYGFQKVVHIVEGGAERYHSVYQGLLVAKKAKYVLIHDGARPLITMEMIHMAIKEVRQKGACVVGMPVKDTIQLVTTEKVIESTPIRNRTWIAQTPQCFEHSIALSAYEKAIEQQDGSITDDAMVVMRYGKQEVSMIEGSYENIKVTTPEDILLAELFLNQRKNKK